MNPPLYWQEAKAHLCSQDPIIRGLIESYPQDILLNQNNPFYTLTRAVIGQQISVKAADAVWQRFEANLEKVSPDHYLAIEPEILRQIGLSRQKISYITCIAEAFNHQVLTPDEWEMMEDDAMPTARFAHAKQLMTIKGIGRWTAEMFLIFYLHRPNILPLSDLGLFNAINRYYGKGKTLSKAQMIELSQQWQPYCTVATWYLWRGLDPVVVQY